MTVNYIRYEPLHINFEPGSDKPLFVVCWRGRKDKKCSGYWHTPNVMDGGFIASYRVENGVCTVSYSKDGFAFSTLLEEVEFNVTKCEEYKIYIKDGHIVVPGVELKIIWNKEIEEAERAKRLEEQREYRKAHPEEFVELENGEFVPKLRLIRLANPMSLKDKIFTEFSKTEPQEDK